MMTNKIAMYGNVAALVPLQQRYVKWIIHRKGPDAGQKWYKKRVWKKTKRLALKEIGSGRYEFHGNGRDLYKAMIKAWDIVPRKFVDVSATEFLSNPMKYGYLGMWLDKKVESR